MDENKLVIESKATNRAFDNLKFKNETWAKIATQFNNNVSVTPRTIDKLRCKWDNLKTKTKQREDARKKHQGTTGEKPDRALELTPQEERVLAIMSGVKAALDNKYDSDAPVQSSSRDGVDQNNNCSTNDVEHNNSDLSTNDDEQNDLNDIFDVEKDNLDAAEASNKQDNHEQEKGKRRKVSSASTDSCTKIDEMRLELLQLQKKQMEEKHLKYMSVMNAIEQCTSDIRHKNNCEPVDKNNSEPVDAVKNWAFLTQSLNLANFSDGYSN